MTPEARAVVLVSGGLDSTTAAAYARREGWTLYALTIRYGQVHQQEIDAARRVALSLGVVRHAEIDVDLRAFGGSSLTGDGEIPKDRWTAGPSGPGDKRQFRLQLPGPRGSPQVPHGAAGAAFADLVLETAAKTDHCFSSSGLWHSGQDG